MKWHGRYLRKRKLGQISILMVFSLVPMFTLFAFVINIGMLVNAKIALQNAVDAAAYAGAATQARQMTDISHLNYYMRVIYKKFIFKYYVLGNVSQKCFPKGDGKMAPQCDDIHSDSPKAFDWFNRDSNKQHLTNFPGVPTVCISLSKESNPCQVARVVPVVHKPSCGIVDPACASLQNAADGIGKIQQASCTKSSVVNQEVLGLWLYATDYDRELNTNSNLQGLISDDIGMMPEEIMTLERINNIVDIINTPPVTNVTPASLAAMKTGRNTLSHARTILAFESMANNLNRDVFIDDSIQMAELIQPPMLLIKPIEIAGLNVGITFMEVDTNGDCGMNIDFFPADVMVGVSKSKLSHVYYAVKGTAKARLLFNPFPFGSSPAEGITLTAYSAAKPFGSRIGPDLSDPAKALEEYTVKRNAHKAPDFSVDIPTLYPMVKIDDAGHTSESSDVLAGYFAALGTEDPDNTGTVASGTVGSKSLALGIHAAMIPDEYELGRYNIPVDSDTNGKKSGFNPYFLAGSSRGDERATYSIWAPFIAEGKPDVYAAKMSDEIDKIVSIAGLATKSGPDPLGDGRKALQTNLRKGLGSLSVTLLQRNAYNVFQMPDPLSTAFYLNHKAPNIPGKVTVKWGTKAETAGPMVATSWVTDHDTDYFRNGRDGYSVKFVALKTLLTSPGKITNDPSGQGNWTPLSGAFNGERADMQKVAH